MSDTAQQRLDPREYNVYKVIERNGPVQYGYGIVCGVNEFPVYGLGGKDMFPETAEQCKAMCEYWCMHMNQAFIAGRLSVDGNVLQYTESSWARLDALYKKAHGIES